jgi:penicillin-binding protein 1A
VRRRRIKRIRKLRLVVLLFLLFWVSVAAFFFGLVFAISKELPALDPARVQSGEVNGYVYDASGKRVLAVLRGSEARVLVSADDISPWMKHAIVDIEDKRFYEHRGVDVHGILRAVWADVRQKSAVQGGSTITQQFVKNSLVSSKRTVARKLREAALAWQLERKWSKTRILTAYLNTIYFGNGAYGVQTAARAYFGHGAAKLTLPEAALLAGIPADPSRFDPVANPKAARARRTVVLRAMLEQDSITPADFRRANKAPLPKPADVRLPATQSIAAPYFANYVTQQLIDRFGSSTVFGAGFKVRTSIDLGLQQAARDAISKWLNWSTAPSAALVAMDPRDGRVLAMIGGNNFHKSQFNLAVQGERQAGSSFKPFVLATALQEGVAPASQLVSKPVTLYADGTFWPVHNYEGDYMGPIDITTATIHSDNSVFAQLTRLVGPPNVVKTAHRLGITSHLEPFLSIGLGAQAVNPLEMARAFGAFANGGFRIDGAVTGNHPRAILAIGDREATDIECGHKHVTCNTVEPHRVLRSDTDAIVNALLQQVVQQGTGKNAAIPGRAVAGKTGTTENYGDAWFVGYTPQLVTAVWVGYPDKLVPMTYQYHGQPVAGGTFPAQIWKTFTEKALKLIPGDEQVAYFPPAPSLYGSAHSIVFRNGKVELDNGNCKQAAYLQFYSGREPSKVANCKPNEVEVPHLVGKSLEFARLRLEQQPLTPQLVFKPAKPLQRLNVVLAQFPAKGTLSSYDKVTLVLPRAIWGVVPDVVGLDLRNARAKLRKAKLAPAVARFTDGRAGVVIGQSPRPGLAASRHMKISLVVGRAG